MTGTNQPSPEDWRKLYSLMDRVHELAPWTWMDETQIFGVQHPDTGEQGFVSVMGIIGEHYAAAVYLGARGLYSFWNLQNAGPMADPATLFEIPQLQASFEDRSQLGDRDRAIIKQLGLKYRGQQSWPMFRSIRPGFIPWDIEPAEASLLILALEQLLDVAPRLKANPMLLKQQKGQNHFMRVPRKEGEMVLWEDKIVTVPPPEPSNLILRMDMEALAYVKSLPPTKRPLEMDLFMLLSPVQEGGKHTRPFFPYVLMTVDTHSGMLLGAEMISPIPALEQVWEQVPLFAIRHFAGAKMRPGVVSVRNEMLHQLLGPVAKELGFKLSKRRTLPHLDPAKAGLMGRFMR